MAKRSQSMSLSRIRLLASDQGDRAAKLAEILEIATELLKEYKKPKARRESGGQDRRESGGRDRGE